MHNFTISFNSPQLILYSLIIFFILAYASYKVYKSTKNLSNKDKIMLSVLRISIWLIFVFLFIETVINIGLYKYEKNKLFVLIDNSASMLINDKNGVSRIKKIKNIITDKTLKNLKNKFNIKYLLFGETVIPLITSDNLNSINGSYYSTDIENAFYSLLTFGIKNSKILLLSDGNSTSNFDIEKISKLLKKTSSQLYTVNLFENENIRDISLYDILYPDEVSVNSKFNLKLKINVLNYNNIKTFLTIWINDKLYKRKNIKLKNHINNIETGILLHKKGINKIKIEINAMPGESIKINNSKSFFIRTIKDKLNVLLVYGKPCWEYKFLKYNFDTDANIKLKTYLKLRKNSLNLLSKENLNKYDLFIIGNIRYNDLPSGFVNNLIKTLNRRSIGVIFTGGENSFKNGDYHISKLKNIIPVIWNKAGEIFESSFTMVPTSTGILTELFGLDDDTIANLPPFDKLNIIKKVKPGTQVFAVSSTHKNFIILAIGKYKRSKIGIFTAYPTWHIGFLNIGINKDMSAYFTFWRKFTQEIVSDKSTQFQLYTDKLMYKKNDAIKINLIAYNKNNIPFNLNKIKLKLSEKKKNHYNFIKDIILEKNSTANGIYEQQITLNDYGEYKLSVNLSGKTAETYFVIKKPSKELYKLQANKNVLKKLSDYTGGKFIKLKNISNLKKYLYTRPIKKFVKLKLLLWDNWIILLLLIGILTFEWWLRKKKGLL